MYVAHTATTQEDKRGIIIMYVAHTATTQEDKRGTSSCMWHILQQHRRTREVRHHVCGTYCNNTGGQERYIIMYVAHTATTQEDERGTSSCMWRILQQHRRTRELHHHVCGAYCNNTGGRERYIIMYVAHTATHRRTIEVSSSCMWSILQ